MFYCPFSKFAYIGITLPIIIQGDICYILLVTILVRCDGKHIFPPVEKNENVESWDI